MPTLLISRSCLPESRILAANARKARWNVQWLERRRSPARLHTRECGLYAETDMALRVARLHGLSLIEPTLDLLARLPRNYLLRQVDFMTLSEAQTLTAPKFVKPADCTAKVFDAAVYEAGRYIFCDDDLSPQTPVLASEPVAWEIEFRVVVMERRIVAFSPYIRGGWLARNAQGQWPFSQAEAEEMLAFAGELLANENVDLPPAFVLDVGFIDSRGWAVVEMNPVWCSGLLGCDLSVILPVLRRACLPTDQLSCADRAWVIERRNAPR
jgi:hypothetical protein